MNAHRRSESGPEKYRLRRGRNPFTLVPKNLARRFALTLSLTPFLIGWLLVWGPLALLTAVGSWRRGESVGRAGLYGFAFPATWVIWFVEDNHRAGRKAFRSR